MVSDMQYREHGVTFINDGTNINIHKRGCADIKRDARRAFYADDGGWDATIRDFHDAVLEVYGPNAGSYFVECGYTMLDWEDYGHDIVVKPCCGSISYNIPTITDDDRAERYGDDREEV